MKKAILFALFIPLLGNAQVLDVDGDGEVGPQEALAVSEQWKGTASAPNAHTHLGQTWTPTGNGRALTIRGNFPDHGFVIGPTKSGEEKAGLGVNPGAALILDNTATDGAELQLGGGFRGVIEAVDESSSSLELRANQNVIIQIQADSEGSTGNFRVSGGTAGTLLSLLESGFFNLTADLGIYNDIFQRVARITQAGNMELDGTVNGVTIQKTAAKGTDELPSYVVSGPAPTEVFSGKATLDEKGEGVVDLPIRGSDVRDDFRYQLTALGGPAPNVHVAEEVHGNRFKIAGGLPGMTVSWEVKRVGGEAEK